MGNGSKESKVMDDSGSWKFLEVLGILLKRMALQFQEISVFSCPEDSNGPSQTILPFGVFVMHSPCDN
jgi:hypothetical protein